MPDVRGLRAYNKKPRLTEVFVYAKLFTSIYHGTLRGNSHGLLVFTNLMAHADSTGHVDVHPRAIAEEVGLTINQVRAALDMLEAPDEESRSPENEGRRIVRLDEHRAWGWRIVNYVKYRSIRSEEDRREQNRLAQAKWREKNKPESAERNQHKPRKPQSAQAEAEAEALSPKGEREKRAPRSALSADWKLPEDWAQWAKTERPDLDIKVTADGFADHWRVEGALKADWGAAWRKWVRNERGTQRTAFNAPANGSAVPSADQTKAAQDAERESPPADPAKRRACIEMAKSAIKRVA